MSCSLKQHEESMRCSGLKSRDKLINDLELIRTPRNGQLDPFSCEKSRE